MNIIILLGLPGAGKTTQSLFIKDKYSFRHISTGDMIREEIEDETPLGIKYKDLIAGGEFVQDDVIMEFIENMLTNGRDEIGFVFDGFPRTLPQAKLFDALLEKLSLHPAMIILLQVQENEALERLLKRGITSGRKDDNEKTIRNRIKIYQERTQPVSDYYKYAQRLVSVDGMKQIQAVFDDVSQIIFPLING